MPSMYMIKVVIALSSVTTSSNASGIEKYCTVVTRAFSSICVLMGLSSNCLRSMPG